MRMSKLNIEEEFAPDRCPKCGQRIWCDIGAGQKNFVWGFHREFRCHHCNFIVNDFVEKKNEPITTDA